MEARRFVRMWWVPAILIAGGLAIYWWIGMNNIIHDKAVNADALQRLWGYGRRIPLRTVVPAHNRWTDKAFIAGVATPSGAEPGRDASVLILDDHYRGSDPTYRSKSGVIGDPVSLPLLCSLPAQASWKGVDLDPVVLQLVHSSCRNFR